MFNFDPKKHVYKVANNNEGGIIYVWLNIIVLSVVRNFTGRDAEKPSVVLDYVRRSIILLFKQGKNRRGLEYIRNAKCATGKFIFIRTRFLLAAVFTAQWNAERKIQTLPSMLQGPIITGGKAAPTHLVGISMCYQDHTHTGIAVITLPNIALLWRNILEDISHPTRKFTTLTKINLTTAYAI